MPIDLINEQIIPYTPEDLDGMVPGHESLSKSGLLRWRKVGVRGALLETELVGTKRVTSKEAIQRWLVAQRENKETIVERPVKENDRRKRSNAVQHELSKLGMK